VTGLLWPLGLAAWALAVVILSAPEKAPRDAGASSQAQAAVLKSTAHPAPAFALGDACLPCHNALASATGEDVSIGTAWRASIMANSARDPYWQAAVRREVLDHPSQGAAIQDECARCHMPMARAEAHARGRVFDAFGALSRLTGAAAMPSDSARLGADGVSCTLCHQISSTGLGSPESFSGRFALDAPSAGGARSLLGPFDVDAGRSTIMRSATGFVPRQATHIQRSELCATCHTLFTEALDSDGRVVARLPEQVPYLEWRHSAYRDSRSCQACHMPEVPSPAAISSVLGDPRDNVSRHEFPGGNAFMLRMLTRYREALGVRALSSELEAAAERTERQLREDTATVAVESPVADFGHVTFAVRVENRTGHKLPTAYPSRRAWLHVTVRDAHGRVMFESGAPQPSGAIEGNDADADPTRHEPHYTLVERPDQVQIYESVMVDTHGRVTTGLLSGVQYAKDNRLLPRGFDKASASADVAVHGEALLDRDFTSGGDLVRFQIALSRPARPLRIEAVLMYQPIAYRWAQNLRIYDAPEPRRFVGYYESMAETSAVRVAQSIASVN